MLNIRFSYRLYYSIIFTIIFFLNSQVLGQSFLFGKQIGGSLPDGGRSISLGPNGSIYSAGYFAGVCDFDPSPSVFTLTSVGNRDVFICKLDSFGNFLWAINFGGTADDVAYSIATDSIGDVYVIGTFSLTVDFDPGVGVYNLTSFGDEDIFIAKYTSSGSFSWAKQFGGGFKDAGYSLKLGKNSNIYATGYFNSVADFDPSLSTYTLTAQAWEDVFCMRLNSSGSLIWAKQLSGSLNDIGYFITTDNMGNVYSTGVFSGTTDFDPTPGTYTLATSGANDSYVSKLDSLGNFSWARKIGGFSNEDAFTLTLDTAGNIYTSGRFTGIADFDPGPANFYLSPYGPMDAFIQKMNSAGNFLWAKQIGGSSFNGVASILVPSNGEVYLSGSFYSTTDFDPGTGTYTLNSSGSSDAFVEKLDASGNFLWAKQIGGGLYDGMSAMTIDKENSIYLLGMFEGTVDLNPGIGTYTVATSGSSDIFLVKLAPCAASPNMPSTISGPTSVCGMTTTTTFSIAPISEATSYSWTLPSGWTGSSQTNTIMTTPLSNGVVTVSATNLCGTNSQTLSVLVNTSPTITVNSGSICSGSSFTMSPSGASTYTFSGGSAVVSPTASASYSVTGTSSAGCVGSNTAVASVSVINATTSASNTGPFCAGTTINIGTLPATSYTWSGPGGFNSNVQNPNISNATTTMSGVYSVLVTMGTCTTTAATTVSVLSLPSPNISSGTPCVGQPINLMGSGGSTYTWTGPASFTSNVASPTIPSASVSNAGVYTLSVTSGGCTAATTFTLIVNTLPTVSANTSASIICGPPFQGTATITASGASTYTWNTTATTTAIAVSPSVTTTYTVTGTDANGCVNTATVTQMVSTCTGIKTFEESLGLIVYPNPTNSKITITYKMNWLGFEIYNSLGEKLQLNKVVGKESVEIDLSPLPNGIYFVKVGTVTRKIIKQ